MYEGILHCFNAFLISIVFNLNSSQAHSLMELIDDFQFSKFNCSFFLSSCFGFSFVFNEASSIVGPYIDDDFTCSLLQVVWGRCQVLISCIGDI